MLCSNVYEQKKFGNVSSATLKIYWKYFNNIFATLVGKGLSETVDREDIFDTKFIFAPFSKFDIAS